jgi:predicted phage terminase large subunit-like protein
MARSKKNASQSEVEQLRQLCKDDLFTFAKFVQPNRLYGEVHKDMMDFLTKPDARPNQLALIPRAHMKSHVIAVWCAWWIYKHPETTILYLSATATLAEAQLYAIKNILESKEFNLLSPEMLHSDVGKREKWTTNEIKVDHPLRKVEGVRDATLVTAGITTNTTGLHADVIVADDVVVPDNAYTEEGRRKVSAAMSQMASIKNTGGITKAVGTRYHPKDQYDTWLKQEVAIFDENDDIVGYDPLWEVFEKVVEENGHFLWPRTQREDGKWFGFNRKELARIKAEYTDVIQFYSQYYNDPNAAGGGIISRDKFQYYDKKFLNYDNGWKLKDEVLNVYASIDFAFSLGKKADYTAIVVVGINPDGHIFVLDIDRFKTDRISEYFEHIVDMHSRWDFKKLRAEVSVAQKVIVRDLKDMITKNGLRLSIDEFRPSSNQGSKEERVSAILEHRYTNMSMWHFRGGHIQLLEEELVQTKPSHDDIKDALASAVDMAVAPRAKKLKKSRDNVIKFNSRFGGAGAW